MTSKNILKVAERLFEEENERRDFLEAIGGGRQSAVGVVQLKDDFDRTLFSELARPSWLQPWVQAVDRATRPGATPQHEQGAFYCLDLSSAFAAVPLNVISDPVGVLVDVCASPGGKSVLGWRTCHPSLLISNETIGKRTAQLISNLRRCAIDPSCVVSADPAKLAEALGPTADVVLVDAPCSGQSLVAKDKEAPGAFHPAIISMNAKRQRRILAHSGSLVRAGGWLLYSTCTFSLEENEENCEWFLKTCPDFSAVPVPVLHEHLSVRSAVPTYRLFPQQRIGAGAFCALFRRAGDFAGASDLSVDDIDTRQRVLWRSGQPSMKEKRLDSPRSHRGKEKRGREDRARDRDRSRRSDRKYRYDP